VLLVAIAFFFICIALITYKFCSNRVDEGAGITLLKEAYKSYRSIEPRIADFDYAPLILTRGEGEPAPESLPYDRTERILLDAVYYEPSAQSHRALGILHLLNKRLDKAINEFEEALSFDPLDARMHSDLGAALLEKGKTELKKEGIQSQLTGKPLEQLSQSFEHIHKALDLDGSLKVASFNLGLLQEQLGLHFEAALLHKSKWKQSFTK
jgi:tetratricopeptide (TPR) repeat protein